jgi:hypothetical protein
MEVDAAAGGGGEEGGGVLEEDGVVPEPEPTGMAESRGSFIGEG